MTSQEPTNEADEIVSTPATPGAQALPTRDDDADEGDDGASPKT